MMLKLWRGSLSLPDQKRATFIPCLSELRLYVHISDVRLTAGKHGEIFFIEGMNSELVSTKLVVYWTS